MLTLVFIGLLLVSGIPAFTSDQGNFTSFWAAMPFAICGSLAGSALFFTALSFDSFKVLWVAVLVPIGMAIVHRYLDTRYRGVYAQNFDGPNLFKDIIWNALIHTAVTYAIVAALGVLAARYWFSRLDDRVDGASTPLVEIPSDRSLLMAFLAFCAVNILRFLILRHFHYGYVGGIFFGVVGMYMSITFFTAMFGVREMWAVLLPFVFIAADDITVMLGGMCQGQSLGNCFHDAVIVNAQYAVVYAFVFAGVAWALGRWARQDGGADSINSSLLPAGSTT